MSSVILNGDTSGSVTLTVPSVAGTNTVTVPSATGTVMVSGNMPAFSAYQSSSQTVTNNTFTKIQLQTEEFDTANCFDSTTNYRFTPTVAGYYQINGATSLTNILLVAIFKNGSEYKRGVQATLGQATVSSIVYFNGSTDYIELYCYMGATGTNNTANTSTQTWFNGSMVRAA